LSQDWLKIVAATFSPTMIVGMLVFAQGTDGTIEASQTRRPSTPEFISRTMRLAYLSPIVPERLVAHRSPCSLSIKDLITAAERPWSEQEELVFES
jgi:hypothetical protein